MEKEQFAIKFNRITSRDEMESINTDGAFIVARTVDTQTYTPHIWFAVPKKAIKQGVFILDHDFYVGEIMFAGN